MYASFESVSPSSTHNWLSRTTDTSFVENPPSSKSTSKFATPAPTSRPPSGLSERGGVDPRGGGRGGMRRGVRGARGSGLARAKPRGAR